MISIGIEAQLEQLKRLDKAYRDVSVSGNSYSKETAKYNWEVGNEKIVGQIQQAQRFVDDNSDLMSDADYSRLKIRLGYQLVQQKDIILSNSSFIEQQQGETQGYVNFYLNESAFNGGVAEPQRNKALWSKPGFVGENEQQQIEKLKEDLQSSLDIQGQIMQPRGQRGQRGGQRRSGEPEEVVAGKKAEDLLVSQADQKEQMRVLLENLNAEGIQQANRRTNQMQQQLSELTDNRMQRYFGSSRSNSMSNISGKIAGNVGTMGGKGGVVEEWNAVKAKDTESQKSLEMGTAGVPLTAHWSYDEPAMGRPTSMIDGFRLDSLGYAQGPIDSSGVQNVPVQPLYVSGNTYSLPVNLPGGEVRLDFAHPSGEVELSILVIPVNRIHTLYGSLVVLAVLVVLCVVIAKWPRMDRREPLTVRRVIGYVSLAVLLTLILASLGLLISVVIIIISEGARHVAASKSKS
ncbi:MAG: hypothetical protein GY869_22260 [Planctomycetes bacterium]|nr:hypothetical protein [Planctomycetota bacterium]